MKFLKFLPAFVLSFCVANLTAQDKKLSLNEGTIDNQFEYVISKSNNYQDYKVIKKTWLYALKAHTADTLNTKNKALAESESIIGKQGEEIASLKDELSTTHSTLDATRKEKDSMAFLGMQMSKTGYNSLVWVIIAGLLGLFLLFVYKFKNSNAVTKQAKQTLAETEEEFEQHRRTALEREQKVRRQLQDEINKQKAM